MALVGCEIQGRSDSAEIRLVDRQIVGDGTIRFVYEENVNLEDGREAVRRTTVVQSASGEITTSHVEIVTGTVSNAVTSIVNESEPLTSMPVLPGLPSDARPLPPP
jgi:hypothetical protein